MKYFELIEIANELYEKNSISEYNLIKLTISRCPAKIRPLLVKFTLNDGEWFNFIREAKENAWIAFTEENNQIHKENILNEDVFAIKKLSGKFQKRWNNKNRSKYCKLHGQANYTTADCTLLIQLKNRKMKLVSDNEINEIIKKETGDENENNHDLNEFINKNNLIYFFNFNKRNLNFLINIQLENKINHLALLDTGADISLMYFKHCSKNIKISKLTKTPNLICAIGNKLNILGICKLKFLFNQNVYFLKTYITTEPLNKIIL
ncbi:hypothetical protein GVAV_000428 [Gurleya vavrai]